jgi:hypothetical protein
MDKKAFINNRLEQFDFIYKGVLIYKRVTLSDLLLKYKSEFSIMKIDESLLKSMLDSLVEGKYLLMNSDSTYVINALNSDFVSIKQDNLNKLSNKRQQASIDRLFKVLPIVLSLITAVTATVISLANLNLTKQKSSQKENRFVLQVDTCGKTNSLRVVSDSTQGR